jgi:hypothetical protein
MKLSLEYLILVQLIQKHSVFIGSEILRRFLEIQPLSLILEPAEPSSHLYIPVTSNLCQYQSPKFACVPLWKILYTFLKILMCVTCSGHITLTELNISPIVGDENKLWISSLCNRCRSHYVGKLTPDCVCVTGPEAGGGGSFFNSNVSYI